MENPTSSVTEEDFKPQRIKMKRGSTSGQTWEVDVGKEWVSSEHQAVGKQVTSDPLEKSKTRNTSRPWWIALETLKEMEGCLKKLNSGVARKRYSWATQQKAEVNKIELTNQLKRSWQNLLKDHFEEAMRTSSSAPPTDGESLYQDCRTTDVRVEPVGDRAGNADFIRQVEAGRKKSRDIPNVDAARCQGQLRLESGKEEGCNLFLEVDDVDDD